jgi:hypothetical protein
MAEDITNIKPNIHNIKPIANESPKLYVFENILGTIEPLRNDPHKGMQESIDIAKGSSKFINQAEIIEA